MPVGRHFAVAGGGGLHSLHGVRTPACPLRRIACLEGMPLKADWNARASTTRVIGKARLRAPPADHFARNPASLISCLWVASFAVSHLVNSAPLIAVVLKAPFSMNSFQSGVSRTFFSRSL